MIDYPVTLTPSGGVVLPGHASALALGYAKNKSVYRLAVTATGEWEGLTIQAFWHVPGGSDPASTLVVDGYVAVPASVTAQPGSGCVTFEGSDGSRTVTSADNADQSAQEAAGSLQALKDGIANGNFKGEPGNDGKSPVVTVTDIENGHRVSITDKDGIKTIDVLNGQAGKDGTQIDDATVGLDAWSSKHIIDTLCPPLEETGNPVVLYPVAGSKLGVKASWEPVQEGSGDPSPDNARPIKGRDSVTVTRCGGELAAIFKAKFQIYAIFGSICSQFESGHFLLFILRKCCA